MKKYCCAKGLLTIISAILILSLMESVSIAQPPTVSISANPPNIQYYESSTLQWNSVNATLAGLNGAPVPVDGSMVVTPGVTTIYEIVVIGIGGTASHSVTVTVEEPYLNAEPPGIVIDLGSVIPGGILTTTITSLLIGHSNMGSVDVVFAGDDLKREERDANGTGIGSYDVIPTVYSHNIFYDRTSSNEITMTLDVTAEPKCSATESADAGIYIGFITITLVGNL